MLYFKQIPIDDALLTADIESAIRRVSAKREASLDIVTSSSYIREDKYFLGIEGANDLQITRIRTNFERFFPKIIVSFPKDKEFKSFRIRYSLLSTIVFWILLLMVLGNIRLLVVAKEHRSDFISVLIIFTLFLCWTLLEIRLTKMKIWKAIKNQLMC